VGSANGKEGELEERGIPHLTFLTNGTGQRTDTAETSYDTNFHTKYKGGGGEHTEQHWSKTGDVVPTQNAKEKVWSFETHQSGTNLKLGSRLT